MAKKKNEILGDVTMDKKTLVEEIIRRLEKEYGQVRTALKFNNPFELLVAVVLSAQCTDERVNAITPQLFKRFPGPREMAQADLSEIEQLVRSCSFFRNKAKNIHEAAKMIVGEFGGKVPDTMEDLIRLPGVARKTANVVLYNAFGKNEGIAVDTHVKRLVNRLGITEQTNPVKIEQELMKLVPRKYWGLFTYLLIEHGRKVCRAKRPDCKRCVLKDICPMGKS